MISVFLVFLGIFIYLKLTRFTQFTVLSVSAILPFSFGKFFSIPDLQFIDWLTITTLLLIIYDRYSPDSLNKMSSINLRGTGIFLFAIIVLVTWTIISIINNEFSASSSLYTNQTGTKRLYFNIFNNVLLFFVLIIFVTNYYEKIDFSKYFEFLLSLSLVIGSLRILTYFLGYDLPFLAGAFDYGGALSRGSVAKYGGSAFRFGGLSEVVILGIPALFANFIIKNKVNIIKLVILLLFLFLSGGRTIMIGVVLSLFVVSFLFFRQYIVYILIASILFGSASIIFLPDDVVKGQLGRLTHLKEKSFMGQDPFRGTSWRLYFENFSANPVFGKGISPYEGFFYSSIKGAEEFAMLQQFSGGHGSYFSLLSTFGLGGIIYFATMLFGGIILALRMVLHNIHYDKEKTAIALFVFILLSIKAVDFITSGNGLSVPILFFSAGLICSIYDLNLSKKLQYNIEAA